MILYKTILSLLATGILLSSGTANALASVKSTDSQVLVIVGSRSITARQLEQAIRSSPIATGFNAMDEEQQAAIRGSMLKDLIYSEMLYQEAIARNVGQRPEVQQELQEFRRGLLYRGYLSLLRESVPDISTDRAIKERLHEDPEALAAARSASQAQRFSELKTQRLLQLGKEDHLQVFKDPMKSGNRQPEAIVAKGDHLTLRLGDLIRPEERLEKVEAEVLMRRLDKRVEQELMVIAAERQGMDVSAQMDNYRRDLLRQTLMKERERSWVPDRATLETYFEAHPELSRIPPTWHVVQLVSGTREEAEALRQRVLAGESLYRLAGDHSIDPYGREHAGDMGWVRPDEAPPALREALSDLPDGELSPVIQTPMGFHLVMIAERKPEVRKPLSDVADRIRRSLILERLSKDFQAMSQRYPIQWQLPDHLATGGSNQE